MKLFFIKYLAFSCGCIGCHYLQKYAGVSPVVSASGIGIAGSFLSFPQKTDSKALSGAISTGAFAGMCVPSFFRHPIELFVLSLLGTSLLSLGRNLASGFGGKWGSIAFAASFLFAILRSAW